MRSTTGIPFGHLPVVYNACVEGFFRLVKAEELNDYKFNDIKAVPCILKTLNLWTTEKEKI